MRVKQKSFLGVIVIIVAAFLFAKGQVAHAADQFSALTIGGAGNEDLNSIIQTTDGGYAAAGFTDTYGAGGKDVYVVKFTSAGALDTSFGTGGTLTVGGPGDDVANSIVQTTDGGYIVGGYTNSYNAVYGPGYYDDFYIIKLTSTGALDASFGTGGILTFGGNDYEQVRSIIQTTDGGYLAVGYTGSYGYSFGSGDFYMVKFTSTGALDTSFGTGGTLTVGGDSGDGATSVIQTADGGYAVAGDTISYGAGDYDFYIIKLTSTGALDTSFGTSGDGTMVVGGPYFEYAKSIVQANDGGYVIAGNTNSYGAGGEDAYIVKLTSAGALDTSFGTGGTLTVGGPADDEANSIVRTTDGGYAFAGVTTSYGTGSGNFYIVKLTSAGALDTSFGTGGTETVASYGSVSDAANSIIQTTDGGYVVAGDPVAMNYSDGFIIKLDAAGSMSSGCSEISGSGGELGSGGETSSGGFVGSGGVFISGGGTISSGGSIVEQCSISAPTVSTLDATDIADTTATANANLGDTGGENPDRLIQWGTTSGSYTDSCDAGVGDVGDYSCAMSGLLPGTTYYFQAEATNSIGTADGDELTFTTAPALPTVVTKAATDIVASDATANASLSDTGGEVPDVMIQWGTQSGVYDYYCDIGMADVGDYSCDMSTLDPSTTYYFQAEATNSAGTAYGAEMSFTTADLATPTVTTEAATSVTTNMAIGNANLSDVGDGEDPDGIIQYGTTSGIYTESCDAGTVSTGDFSCEIDNLPPSTTYYFRAEATNSIGTSYGAEMSFTTKNALAVVTKPATNITMTTATLNADLTGNNDGTPDRMINWGTESGNYTNTCDEGAGDEGNYSCDLTGLSPGTTYYFQAEASIDSSFAMNDVVSEHGILAFLKNLIGEKAEAMTVGSLIYAYGDEVSFTTPATVSAPTVTTKDATNVNMTSVTANANLTDTGGENPDRLIQYGTTSGSYPSSCDAGTGGTGEYSCNLLSLTPDTTYYFRAEATNSGGTSYGDELSFTTADITQPATPVETSSSDTSSSNPFDDCQPKNLKAKALSSSEIKLTWRDNCTGEEGYDIERQDPHGKFKKIASVGRNVKAYTDKGLEPSTKYTYRVRAYRKKDKSNYTNKASATTLAVAVVTAPVQDNTPTPTPIPEPTPTSEPTPTPAPTPVDVNTAPENIINKNPQPEKSSVIQKTKDIITSPTGQKASTTTEAVGLLVGTLLAVASTSIPLMAASSGASGFASGAPKRFSFFGILAPKERKINWGVVFDIDTHKPLAGALVSIISAEEKVLDTATTNAEGKFGFLATKGSYTFRVTLKDYTMFTESQSDSFYGKVYDGQAFLIKEDDVAEMNIALKSTKINWSELVQRKMAAYNVALAILGNNLFNIIFYVCFAISLAILYLTPSLFNAAVVVVYLVMLAYNLFFKVKKYGSITDSHGKPLPFTMVSLYVNSQPEQRAAFSISDIFGRYFVLTKNDKYLMKMQGRALGGHAFKKLFNINVRNGVFKEDIAVNEHDYGSE